MRSAFTVEILATVMCTPDGDEMNLLLQP